METLTTSVSNLPVVEDKEKKIKIILGHSIKPDYVKFYKYYNFLLLASNRVFLQLKNVDFSKWLEGNEEIKKLITSDEAPEDKEHIMVILTKMGNHEQVD